MTMNGFVGIMAATLFIAWAQDGADRQRAGSWHRVPSITILR
jgi:hypothetical protein